VINVEVECKLKCTTPVSLETASPYIGARSNTTFEE
jgi:hypothetical protein